MDARMTVVGIVNPPFQYECPRAIRMTRYLWGAVCVVICLPIATSRAQDEKPVRKVSDQPARRMDGYKGIWFTLGQFYGPGEEGKPYSDASRQPVFPYGDKYSGGLGTYTAKHTPLAIYCPAVDKTFFVYGGTTDAKERHLLCMISYYDHQRNRVPRPVVVHDKMGVDDPHDNPSLAIDGDGYLWVFVSGRARSRPGFKYRSTRPYSIDQFELVSREEMTYPQPQVIAGQGFVNLFTKYTGIRELYWESSRDGLKWSKDEKLAGIREPGDERGGHYQTTARHQNRIGTFFNRHPNGNVDQRTDLYYLQTDNQGTSWSNVSGRQLQVPLLDVGNSARVFDYRSRGLNVYLKDMGFDREGRPALLYLTSRGHEPGPPNGPRHFCLARWDGNRWLSSKICETDHNYDMGSLYLSEDEWVAWLPSTPGPQAGHGGGELVIWRSRNRGESWTRSRQVTQGSLRNQNYARRPINACDPFFVFWADGDPTRFGESHLYFSTSSGESVWRLPYQMDTEYAEPELVPFQRQ